VSPASSSTTACPPSLSRMELTWSRSSLATTATPSTTTLPLRPTPQMTRTAGPCWTTSSLATRPPRPCPQHATSRLMHLTRPARPTATGDCQSVPCQCPKDAHEHLSSTKGTLRLAGHDDNEDQQQLAAGGLCSVRRTTLPGIDEGPASFTPSSPPPQSIDPAPVRDHADPHVHHPHCCPPRLLAAA